MLKKNKVNLYFSINKNQNLKGGGFNFLNYLEYKLRKKKNISKSLAKSNIILINSHHNFLKNFFIKLFFPRKLFIHRIDGPISKYTGKNDYRDYLLTDRGKNDLSDAIYCKKRWIKKNNEVTYNTKNLKKNYYQNLYKKK